MSAVCQDCPASISPQSKTGRCRSCAMKAKHADPAWKAYHQSRVDAVASTDEYREKRRLGGLKRYADPAARKATSDARKAGFERNPELLERLRESAVTRLAAARDSSNFDWSAWYRECQAARRAWCPADRWEQYQKLRTTRGVGAEEAKRMILEDIAAAERKRLAAMTPHERNMERVRNGAALTIKPDLRKADPAFTLGGIASGALA